MEIKPIDLRELDEKVSNVYEGIIVAASKAKNINDERKLEFRQRIELLPDRGADDDGEDIDNPDQLRVSLEFEKREKPHIEALEMLLKDELKYKYSDQ